MRTMSKVIGISGVARAGKDTFASILTTQLKAAGKSVDKFAFADALKQDCDDFCKKKLGISAFTQVPAEKLIIRPLLVWYGDAKRKQSNGRYWVDIIERQVKASKADYCLVTDVRYDFYEKDEISWVKDERNGVVVHVSRWWFEPTNANLMGSIDKCGPITMHQKMFVQPANDHERENDPKVKAKADCVIEWEDVKGRTMEQLAKEPSLIAHVDSFIFNHLF
jgi:hypothetical protein